MVYPLFNYLFFSETGEDWVSLTGSTDRLGAYLLIYLVCYLIGLFRPSSRNPALFQMFRMWQIWGGKIKTFSGEMSSQIFLKHLPHLPHPGQPSHYIRFCFLFYCFLVIWYIYLFQMLSQIVADIGSHIPRQGGCRYCGGRRPEVVVHSTTTTSPTTFSLFFLLLLLLYLHHP